jgi:hypothetical protein
MPTTSSPEKQYTTRLPSRRETAPPTRRDC